MGEKQGLAVNGSSVSFDGAENVLNLIVEMMFSSVNRVKGREVHDLNGNGKRCDFCQKAVSPSKSRESADLAQTLGPRIQLGLPELKEPIGFSWTALCVHAVKKPTDFWGISLHVAHVLLRPTQDGEKKSQFA